ncbi:hypothetical protein [Acanthamoeba polyphaga mimivirus]|uniref:Uncharacterized protein n=1 Tax=Acanthamoeba polyphaga mimivirus TaxID=212035 RepID=A0A2L2DKX5_MIMIV|nr:hypothetical protein [Acanthamoeba polyphaga mimivirus]
MSGEMVFYLNMENKAFHIIANKNNDNKYVPQLITKDDLIKMILNKNKI